MFTPGRDVLPGLLAVGGVHPWDTASVSIMQMNHTLLCMSGSGNDIRESTSLLKSDSSAEKLIG